jgi:hypothetical protein
VRQQAEVAADTRVAVKKYYTVRLVGRRKKEVVEIRKYMDE